MLSLKELQEQINALQAGFSQQSYLVDQMRKKDNYITICENKIKEQEELLKELEKLKIEKIKEEQKPKEEKRKEETS